MRSSHACQHSPLKPNRVRRRQPRQQPRRSHPLPHQSTHTPHPHTGREIAAALESVFPRIGLKAFTALPQEDKTAQLNELANIVLGIRLFNRCGVSLRN